MAGNTQYDANLLPNTTGLDLGSSSQRWDGFFSTLDFAGLSNVATVYVDTTVAFATAINTAIGLLPSTGGIVDATGFTGAQSALTTITISKPVRLLLGGVTVTSAVSPLFTVSSQFELLGWGKNTTTLTASATGAIATFSGTAIKWLKWQGLKLQGGATSSTVFTIADYSGGVFDMSQGLYVFEDLWVNAFKGANAMRFGKSCYWIRVVGSLFTDNTVDMYFDESTEAKIIDTQFVNLASNNYQTSHISLVGGSSIFKIEGCDFENNSCTNSPLDILITPSSSAGGGYYWITNNKFGSEGETASRIKIKIASGTTQLIGVKIIGNNFIGGAGLSNVAISALGAIESFIVNDNFFAQLGTIVNDATTPISNAGGQGHSTFLGNRIYSTGTSDFTVFANGGRCFAEVQDITAGTESNAGYIQTMYEAPSLSNRLTYSEAINSWTANSITVTTGQTDPFGTTRACLLTKQGGASNSVFLQFTPVISRMTFSLWAKTGTANKVQVGIYNLTTGLFLEMRTFLLTSSFQRFKFTVGGIDTAVNYRFYIYPDGQEATAKTCTVFGAQASDFDSDYLKTTGTVNSDTAYGGVKQRYLALKAGIIGEPVAGANLAGNDLTVSGGVSTGTGLGGNIVFTTTQAGGAGSSANAFTRKFSITQTGIGADENGFKHKRSTAGCATAASVGATCTTVVTWTTTFGDASYTASCSGRLVASGVPVAGGITAQSASSVTFQTVATTAAAAQFTNIDCVGIHD